MNNKRFETIIELLGKNGTVADIGCDHGKMSAYIASNGLAKHVYATDISLSSLNKARALYKTLENVEFVLGDGFSCLPQKPDAAIVAGMGGETIAKMLTNDNAKTTLVLQPMKDSDILYKALYENDYKIEKVKIAREDRRYYEIIRASFQGCKTNKFNFLYPPLDALVADDDSLGFFEREIKILSRAAKGAELGDNVRFNELSAQLDLLNEVIKNVKSKRCNSHN